MLAMNGYDFWQAGFVQRSSRLPFAASRLRVSRFSDARLKRALVTSPVSVVVAPFIVA
jgi:hypothetical protein